jgi:TPR repeat protein
MAACLLVSVRAADAQDGFGQRDQASVDAVESLNAYAAYKLGDYQTARERWLALAERGNTSAMINIANMYEQGQGVEQDQQTALSWQRRAADLGDSRAQLHLGVAYEEGHGVERDPRQAAEWFRKAAEQDDATAQFNLGVMLATAYGEGLDQSTPAERTEAITWLERAADGGHPDAAQLLSTLRDIDGAAKSGGTATP